MPVNPTYLQQNNDFSRKQPFLSILIVIAARQGLLEPPHHYEAGYLVRNANEAKHILLRKNECLFRSHDCL